MPSLRNLLSRRWLLAFLGVLVLLFGLAMLHPYPRQSLFGPKIDGVPWCIWEDEIRRHAVPDRPTPWLEKSLEKNGLLSGPRQVDRVHLLPVILHLANDSDARVRRYCLSTQSLMPQYWIGSGELEAQALSVLNSRLQHEDEDPQCQLQCAYYLWQATQDREMIKVPLKFLDNPDPNIRYGARLTLCHLATADVDASFPLIADIATSDDSEKRRLRGLAVQVLGHFGRRSIPLIRKAMNESDWWTTISAIDAARQLADQAEELIPDLLAKRDDPDEQVRGLVAIALNRIDGNRFPEPPTRKK